VDATATARDYFSRPSGPEYKDQDEEVEMDLILKEAAQLKQVAGWYKHPERPVVCTDPCATARNYFNRYSAPSSEDADQEERDLILAETAQLKTWADYYRHPEKPVVTTDPCATGRNYFTRASAPEYEDFEEEYQRDLVFSDIAELKTWADYYRHPEKPVVTTDPCATGRNYFTRASAPEYEDFEEEYQRDLVFSDIAELKRVANWYRHPEIGVSSSIAVGRNFFSRFSASPTESAEESEERARILEDAAALKKLSIDYRHPEIGVKSSISVTRNFFSRVSSDVADLTPEEEEERSLILADMTALKKLAVDYLHPEKPVVSSVNCVRNYFDRASAEGHADFIHSEGHALHHGHLVDEHHGFDAHHYHYDHHNHDDDSSHFSHQSDHFELEEDIQHFRSSLYAAHAVHETVVPVIKEGKEGEEGDLSRSPSGVMLFDLDDA
jgi:hypothetical protein